MKPPKTLSILALFLALAAVTVAAPAVKEGAPSQDLAAAAAAGDPDCPFPPGCNGAAEAAAPKTETAAAEPLSAPAACADPLFAGGPVLLKCGACSANPCSGANLNSVCGSSGGQVMRCIDDGFDCTDTRPVCTCRTGPI